MFVVRGILTFSSSYCLTWVANKVVLDLRAAMFSRLVRLPARYFDDHSSGALLSKVAYDVSGVTGAATTVLTVLVKDTIAIVGLLAWLFYLNWKLTLIALVIGPPIALTVRSSRSACGACRARRCARSATWCTCCRRPSTATRWSRCSAARTTRRALRARQMLRGFVMRGDVPAALTTPITHMLAALALAVIIYISMQDTLATRATVGEFASFITAMLMLLAPLKHLTEINTALQRGLAAAESVFALIDPPVEDDRGTGDAGPRARRAAFENVGFTYPTRTEPALADIDLHIRPARRSRWSAARAAARPRWSTCCRASTRRPPAACCSTATTSRASRSRACAPTSRSSARRSCCSTTRSTPTSPTAAWAARRRRT